MSETPVDPGAGRLPAGERRQIPIAAAASLGAGTVHAAAIGAHGDHRQVVWTFTVLAALQIGWGVVASLRPSRAVSVIGVLVNGAALVGWIMAKSSGVSFVDGMETAEPVQWADGLCAALAAVAVVGAGAPVVTGARERLARRSDGGAPVLQRLSAVSALLVGVLAVSGMAAAANHSHAGSDDHAHAGSDDHAHEPGVSFSGEGGEAHEHESPAVPPTPYDPELPIDLGGVDGVTPQQQARAENLIAITLARLPQFADVTTLESRGYHSIFDAGTGHEHFINWDYINDGRELDPDHPESLVFEVNGSERKLVSAMYMAEGGVSLDEVPDIGGPLTQWHIHDNLCYSEADPPRVVGLTQSDGTCGPGTRTLGEPVPMIHVWITPHVCGPFAALDGVAAGQVKPGETHLCDEAHGAGHGHDSATSTPGRRVESASGR